VASSGEVYSRAVPVCVSCGHENSARAKFCEECGFLLGAVPPRAQLQRKTVTVLFCDLAGSTALGETIDAERLRAVLASYFERMRTIVERHGGTVEKFIGDAVMAVFGVPIVHEDDALRAVRSANEMRNALPALGLEGRVGVMTGEVVAGTVERLATGDAVNVAARLEAAATLGEVLLGEPTLALVRDAVDVEPVEPLELKGKSEPVPAYRLIRVRDIPERLHESRFVGRAHELALVGASWRRVRDAPRCELLTIVGEAGMGKARLVDEAVASIDATVVRGRCPPYGDGITYWPIVAVLRQLDVLPEEDAAAEAIRSLLGESNAATSPQEIAWAFRRTLEQAALTRPIVVVFDDIQWGEETFLDLIEHVAHLSSGTSILLLCLARPELTELRPDWPVAHRLEPLGDEPVHEIIPPELPGELRERIARSAGGNPLFIEEMLAVADEAGRDVAVPPTLQALLAARLDQLPAPERSVLECGSIEGEIFHRGAVQALALDADGTAPQLDALVRKQLLRRDKPLLAGEDGFRFRHLLIRDAAYDGLAKQLRADLHERFASWLERYGTELVELDELLGYHLERAWRYRVELGTRDDALAARAGDLLATAGLRAADRADVPAAIKLLTRAVALVPASDHSRAKLLLQLGYAHYDAGALEEANALFAETSSVADSEQPELASRAVVGLLAVSIMSGRGPVLAEVLDGIEREIARLQELDDPIGLAEAYREAAKAQSHLGRTEHADRSFEQALVHARRCDNRRIEADVLVWRLAMQCWGYLPAGVGLRITDELVEQRRGGMAEAFALVVRGRYRAIQGDLDEGRADIEAGRALIREFGADFYVAGSGNEQGKCELEAGEPAAAETVLREAYEMLEQMGSVAVSATVAAMLARTLVEQGRLDEADRFAKIAEETATADDPLTHFGWRSVRSLVLARRGDLVGGEMLAREAVAIAERTDFLEDHAAALLALAEIMALGGRKDEGRAAIERAIKLYERKESVVGVERARTRLRGLCSTAG
jgi:class 3 adenylate cyclase/tetratricopeptide (TPR) repeat protein